MAGRTSMIAALFACALGLVQLPVGAHDLKINSAGRQLQQMDYGYGDFDATAYFSVSVALSGLTLADVEGTSIGDDLCDALVEAFEAAAPAGLSAPLVCSTTFSAARRRALLQGGVIATSTITTDGDVFTLETLAGMKGAVLSSLPGIIEGYAKSWAVDAGAITVLNSVVTVYSADGTLTTILVEYNDDGTVTVTTTVTSPDGTTTTTTETMPLTSAYGYGYGVKAVAVI